VSAFQGSSAVQYLTDIISTVTAFVRGKVQTYAPNQYVLGPTGTIPDETLGIAIILARYRLLTQLPGTQLITKWREQERDEAYKQLDEFTDGSTKIQGYPDGSSGTTATGVPQRLADFGGEDYFPPYGSPVVNPAWTGDYW
jgi:hypothetical protein